MKSAIANGKDLGISFKQSIEVCNWIKGREVDKVLNLLEQVTLMKMAVPFKRFTGGAGHKPGIGPGKYPVKTAKNVYNIVKLAKANAVNQGLNSGDLVISRAIANKASTPMHHGRHSGRQMKRTHLMIEVLEESKEKKMKKSNTKNRKTTTKKNEQNPNLVDNTGINKTGEKEAEQ